MDVIVSKCCLVTTIVIFVITAGTFFAANKIKVICRFEHTTKQLVGWLGAGLGFCRKPPNNIYYIYLIALVTNLYINVGNPVGPCGGGWQQL